jgi:3-hydroxy-9,10-secoandrosta-1,3,5(10)-triene-9,17-dione monooxygenase reductase component
MDRVQPVSADESVKSTVDGARFRQVLGHFPTGVTVITAITDAGPVGLAVGSFFSVSLDPPLVGFCVMLTSSTWPVIERSGHFAVSVLADDQIDVCRQLATKDPDKFIRVHWTPALVTGAPLVDGAVAHIDCTTEEVHQAGDHWVVIGRVHHMSAGPAGRSPLLFCAGTYGRHQAL